LVPAHLSLHLDQMSPLFFTFVLLIMIYLDITMQVLWMLLLSERIADEEGTDDHRRIRKKYLALPLIRILAYGLYFLHTTYRRSLQNQSLASWAGPGSGLCRKLRDLLPRTSKGYICLRAMTTVVLCTALLCCVAESQHAKPKNFAQLVQAVLKCWPILPALLSLCRFTFDLLRSSKHFAKWIYRYERDFDRVTFQLQIDCWHRREQSSSLGLDLGGTSNSLDEGNRKSPIYAPLQTMSSGESLSKLLSAPRQDAKKQMSLFVRCECCLDGQSAIDLVEIQPVQAPSGIRFWSRGRLREQQAYSEFTARRNMLLKAPPESVAGGSLLSHPVSPVDESQVTNQTPRIKDHELCVKCTTFAFRLQYDFTDSWYSSWIRGWTSARNFRSY